VAEYGVANKIADEVTSTWCVLDTLKKHRDHKLKNLFNVIKNMVLKGNKNRILGKGHS
jgi:hypothetical protein